MKRRKRLCRFKLEYKLRINRVLAGHYMKAVICNHAAHLDDWFFSYPLDFETVREHVRRIVWASQQLTKLKRLTKRKRKRQAA